jgi:hypothetical protein
MRVHGPPDKHSAPRHVIPVIYALLICATARASAEDDLDVPRRVEVEVCDTEYGTLEA